MPHIIVKLWPGCTDQQKSQLADQIVKAGVDTLGKGESYFSVAFEEIDSSEWAEKVFKPEIEANWDALYRKPGYKM